MKVQFIVRFSFFWHLIGRVWEPQKGCTLWNISSIILAIICKKYKGVGKLVYMSEGAFVCVCVYEWMCMYPPMFITKSLLVLNHDKAISEYVRVILYRIMMH